MLQNMPAHYVTAETRCMTRKSLLSHQINPQISAGKPGMQIRALLKCLNVVLKNTNIVQLRRLFRNFLSDSIPGCFTSQIPLSAYNTRTTAPPAVLFRFRLSHGIIFYSWMAVFISQSVLVVFYDDIHNLENEKPLPSALPLWHHKHLCCTEKG